MQAEIDQMNTDFKSWEKQHMATFRKCLACDRQEECFNAQDEYSATLPD
ncbi:hypothetical protein GeomeDRAFT_3134 [Geobacter metallireducens RCH3]|nr:hypothetical protein [Geobacter metallireducens]EHP84368.1 hypothetical protein GeomeDRAFT_3134 [Geobacter metallireducens RCH3]